MSRVDNRKIWLVEHPTHQYNEDVKMLARQNHLKIYDSRIDVNFDPSRVEQNPPKLTKVGEQAKKKPGPKKKVEVVEEPTQSEE